MQKLNKQNIYKEINGNIKDKKVLNTVNKRINATLFIYVCKKKH